MKRTEKGKANSRQKSTAKQQARQEQSQQQAKQTKGLRPRQGEVRGKAQHRGKLQPASPARTDADVQQGQYELKLGEVITTIPEIDFDEEIVEYKKIVLKAQEQ